MQFHTLKRRTKLTISKRVGRGGKRGKTSGRGTKGQKARSGHKMRPEIRDLIKKIPKLRGRGVNSFKSFAVKPAVINVGRLEEIFSAGTMITRDLLLEKNIISRVRGVVPRVKVLGEGELTKKLSLSGLLVSATAKDKIEKVGGSVA
mgnify:CR=1 FL=1